MKDPLLRDYPQLNLGTSSTSQSLSSSAPSTPEPASFAQRSTISTSESGQELWPLGVKLGIVRLGYSAGKLKYTLVDEQDIVLAREYTFEARLEVNRENGFGSGAVVFAYAYLTSTSLMVDRQMILLQDLIWRRHYGPIPERKRVVHRNHISMDNRLDNLCLLDLDHPNTTHVWYTMVNQVVHQVHQQVIRISSTQTTVQSQDTDINFNHQDTTTTTTRMDSGSSRQEPPIAQFPKSSTNGLHLTLYWAAIQQLPPEQQQQQQQQQQHQSASSTVTEESNPASTVSSIFTVNTQAEIASASKCYDQQGNLIIDQGSALSYFECHYGPCVCIERQPREFSICGRCQETRYCGTTCQQLDWPYHKRYCRHKARRQSMAPYNYNQYRSSSSPSSTNTTPIRRNSSHDVDR